MAWLAPDCSPVQLQHFHLVMQSTVMIATRGTIC
jgi:hypothetical protein